MKIINFKISKVKILIIAIILCAISFIVLPKEVLYLKSLGLLLIMISTFYLGTTVGTYTMVVIIFRDLLLLKPDTDLDIENLLGSITMYIIIYFFINIIRKTLLGRGENKWYEGIVENLPVEAYIFKDNLKYFQNKQVKYNLDKEANLENILKNKKIEEYKKIIFKIQCMLKNKNQRRLKFTVSAIEDGRRKYYKVLIIKNERIKDLFTMLFLDITKSEVYRRTSCNTVSTYKDIMYNMPNAIIMHKNSKIVYANDEAIKIIKAKSLNDIKDKPIIDFIDERHKVSFEKKLNYILEGRVKIASIVNETIRDLENEIINVEAFSINLPNNNGVIITSFKNLTEAKKLKEEQRQLELKLNTELYNTEFFSNISHELKTPMTVIFSTVQVLEHKLNKGIIKDTKGNVVSQRIKQIKQNIYRELRLVDNMLDLTIIESGNYNIELQKFDIVAVVEDITLSMVNMARDKNISVIFDTTTEELEIVCDEYNIERIILNLLSNAIKYSKDNGEILVFLEHNENNVKISVKDTGIGISKEKRACLFKRHEMNSDSDTLKSSGIGLSLVKSLVELLEGSVYLNEEYNGGAEFIVELPLNKEITNQYEDIKNKNDNLVDRIKVTASQIYSK